MPIYQEIPIRLQVSLVSTPPVAPIDANTGAKPRFYRGGTIALNLGIFDSQGNPVDLSNIVTLQAILAPAQLSPYALVTKTLTSQAEQIYQLITLQGWRSATQWNASFVFEAADTDQGLGGLDELDYWLTIVGVTSAGAPIYYSAGPVTIYNAGNFLPNVNTSITSRHAQTTAAGDVTVTPTSQLHKEIVTVGGVARTSNIILGIAGIDDGAELTLVLILPGTTGIVLNVRSNSAGSAVISTIGTGVVLQCRLKYYFDADAAAWVPEVYNLPSP